MSSTESRNKLLFSLLPLILVAVTFAGVFVVRSGAEDRYEHSVVLSMRNDARTGAYDNRNQLAEVLRDEISSNSTNGVETELAIRFNNIIDLTSASTRQIAATAEAQRLIDFSIENRDESSTAIPRATIEASQLQLAQTNSKIDTVEAELDALGEDADEADRRPTRAELDGLYQSRTETSRRLTTAETDLAAVISPIEFVSSGADGLQSPQPARDAAVAAAAVALIALVGLSVTVWRN